MNRIAAAVRQDEQYTVTHVRRLHKAQIRSVFAGGQAAQVNPLLLAGQVEYAAAQPLRSGGIVAHQPDTQLLADQGVGEGDGVSPVHGHGEHMVTQGRLRLILRIPFRLHTGGVFIRHLIGLNGIASRHSNRLSLCHFDLRPLGNTERNGLVGGQHKGQPAVSIRLQGVQVVVDVLDLPRLEVLQGSALPLQLHRISECLGSGGHDVHKGVFDDDLRLAVEDGQRRSIRSGVGCKDSGVSADSGCCRQAGKAGVHSGVVLCQRRGICHGLRQRQTDPGGDTECTAFGVL